MVNKKVTMRDYYRGFITRANKEAGVTFNAAKLNSKEECEEYLLNLIKNLRHKKQDNKAYIKEIDSLKEEIEILNTGNKRLEAERMFYITQAEEAGKAREKAENYSQFYEKMTKKWQEHYFCEKDNCKIANSKLNDLSIITFGLGIISIVEAISITMLIWK
jgi:hypothetical protein